ncbi:TPR-like protein [Phanerochaete sordida]|uniref:TPR-like protein n=1 Tax=Phanerochaete sordida TaxID=48140 RepID=A0A9P3LBH5_9APHY|nr:TPR-like protein [Phanerochaete sordida]
MAEATSTPTTSELASAALLKAEGNKLFASKDYRAARTKYSEAIEVNGRDATLYANRAACSIAMKKYMDSAYDSQQAVALDPGYTKAWARLGTSLRNIGRYEDSVAAFKSALESLPAGDDAALTEAQRGVREQVLDGLRGVRERLLHVPAGCVCAPESLEGAPWRRAADMQRAQSRQPGPAGAKSSVWVLARAQEEFELGMKNIMKVRAVEHGHTVEFIGINGAICSLTNGILRDYRVFHVIDREWMTHCAMQVQMELLQYGYDVYNLYVSGGPQRLIAEAMRMSEREGWDVLRPGLSTILRCWIMDGFHHVRVREDPAVAIVFLDAVVEVLEWGRETWKDLPETVRGEVFEDAFLVGVKSLRLYAFLEHTRKVDGSPESLARLEMSHEIAVELRDAVVNATEPDRGDQGSWLSFYVYPKAHAISAIALYHRRIVDYVSDEQTVQEHWTQATQAFLEAARTYPDDDEHHVQHLGFAVDAMVNTDATVHDLLDVFDGIEQQLPAVNEIWEQSISQITFMRTHIPKYREIEQWVRGRVARGELRVEDSVTSI